MLSKRFMLLLSLAMSFLGLLAQDVIVAKDGSTKMGKVVEISDTEVKYLKADKPDGPLYTIKVEDIMRINYEDGQSDIFTETTDYSTPSTYLAGNTGEVNNRDLYGMYQRSQDRYKTTRLLKRTAFIGGGALMAAGIIVTIVGINNAGGFNFDTESGLFGAGIGLFAAGAIAMPSLYFYAKHKEKQIDEFAVAHLYNHKVLDYNGKSLSLGVAYMANRTNTRTLGLDMSFSF